MPRNREPTHPGQMLLKEFLESSGIRQNTFSKYLGWTYSRLNRIIRKHCGVSAASALSIADALNTEPEFWLNLQRDWDLWRARKTHRFIKPIKQKKP